MALPAATVWEVRPTVGADTNGGGFVAGASGTDYSQQNSAQYSASDLASISSLVVASVSHSFVSADVGNLINIASGTGFTSGFYQIVSVSAGQATLDRSPGTVGAGGVYAVGGALAHISVAYANATASNAIYAKATGSNVETTTVTLTQRNSPPMRFIGYGTTRGDGAQVTWTTATNSTALVAPSSGNPCCYVFENFLFTNTAGTPAPMLSGSVNSQLFLVWFNNCNFSGFTSAILGGYQGGTNFDIKFVFFDNCLMSGCTSHGVTSSGAMTFTGCIIQGNGGDGIHVTQVGSGSIDTGALTLIRTVVYNNTGSGINFAENLSPFGGQYTYPLLINSVLDQNGADGITWSNTQTNLSLQMQNCIIENNGGFGLNNTGSTANLGIIDAFNNAYRNNASGNFAGGFANGPGDVALTAEPFNNPSGGDFSLNSTAGGGAACKAVGFPSSLP